MSIQTASGTHECPECFASVELDGVMRNEVVQCRECGTDLEVTDLEPLTLELAPEEEEDWGE
jgi:alpha-aminoadipate carrier protein LysW